MVRESEAERIRRNRAVKLVYWKKIWAMGPIRRRSRPSARGGDGDGFDQGEEGVSWSEVSQRWVESGTGAGMDRATEKFE